MKIIELESGCAVYPHRRFESHPLHQKTCFFAFGWDYAPGKKKNVRPKIR